MSGKPTALEAVKIQARAVVPIEVEVVEDTDSTCAINLVRCAFAEYFRAIGAADVGALLTCGVDFATEARLRPDWEFRRSQTIMGGASHCDFRWRLRAPAEREDAAPPRATRNRSFWSQASRTSRSAVVVAITHGTYQIRIALAPGHVVILGQVE